MFFKEASEALIYALETWGIRHIFGVTGGGVFEITKYLTPYKENLPYLSLFSIVEYAAGFAPIGHYLNNGQISACLTVPGAATKLVSCGASDAKILRIPALYLISLNHSESLNNTPLQDVGPYGMNITAQLKSEFADDVVYIQNLDHFDIYLAKTARILADHRPVVILFHPNILKKSVKINNIPKIIERRKPDVVNLKPLLNSISIAIANKKQIYLYVCSEAGFDTTNYAVIRALQEKLNARVLCTVNGSNACVDLPNFYGHVGIGGHDEINDYWRNLGENDLLIALGMEAGDYHFFKKKSKVSEAWIFTNQSNGYGFINESYQHRFENACHIIHGKIHDNLNALLQYVIPKHCDSQLPTLKTINTQTVSKNKVDLHTFYTRLKSYWQPSTICFDDVCCAYRDRQFIMTHPISNVRFFTSQDSSAMGGAFGFVVGAKIANPKEHCFAFIGDGCWRLIAGAFPEAANIGIVVFVFNNQNYGVVTDVITKVYPDLDKKHHHTQLIQVDFVGAAKACGWDAGKLKPNLSNLKQLMEKAYNTEKSLLIEIPCEPYQNLGFNPRINVLNFS